MDSLKSHVDRTIQDQFLFLDVHGGQIRVEHIE